jgi:hypothetical protein
MCETLGDYEGVCCSEEHIQPLAKEIGLGPSLYLITIRKLTCFFLMISLLNLPVYLFLWFSNDTIPTTMGDLMARLSLGSISQDTTKCSSMNYASSTTLKIQCPNKFGRLQNLTYLGIGKDDNTNCPSLLKTPIKSLNENF